jgi:hypothetical protein
MFYSGLPLRRSGAALALALPFSSLPAIAHDAIPTAAQPSGWTYPLACCSGIDCREVADEDIIESPEGYVIATTGEVIPMTSRKVRDSPDGVFHWCSVKGKPDGATICLFVPPRAF